MSKIFFGETQCTAKYASGKKRGRTCNNAAYYKQDGSYLCGVHSKKQKRTRLPKNPKADEIRAKLLKDRETLVEETAKENKKNNKKGHVIVTKLRMMKQPEHHDGYLKIFPNFKHQTRKDGFGCSSLSPKSMGPIDHKMPGLPIAKKLENYHQGAKIFSNELKSSFFKPKNCSKKIIAHFNGCATDDITDESIRIRKKMYADETPYRHKYQYDKMKKITKKNVNIPLFSLFYDKNGIEHRFNYLQCRYFYCQWYEKIATELDDFKKLKKMIYDGYNLQIVGYDGYPVTKTLYDHYVDISKPFGHELVLYTMLVINDSSNYPWNQFYKKNKTIYSSF